MKLITRKEQCRHLWMNAGFSFQGLPVQKCLICHETKKPEMNKYSNNNFVAI